MVLKTELAELPAADTKRWVARRKAAVVVAVRRGLITTEEACRRYDLSEEEFSSWQHAFEAYGVAGLRVGVLQRLRGGSSSRPPKAASTAATFTQQAASAPAEE